MWWLRAIALLSLGAIESLSPSLRRRSLSAPASSVRFDAAGSTLHVVAGSRLFILDAGTLEERGTMDFAEGATLDDEANGVLLVSKERSHWLGSVATHTLEPLTFPAGVDGSEAHLSADGRFVVLSRLGDAVGPRAELVLDVYDTRTKRWKTVKGLAFPIAGGTFGVCSMTHTAARWCYSRGPDRIDQQLDTGATTVRAAAASGTNGAPFWSARRNEFVDFAYGKNGVEIRGPGATRWVEVSDGGIAPQAITCDRSARAIALREDPRRIELRELPSWKLVWEERAGGSAENVTCAPNGRRVAWTTTEGAGSFVYARSD